MTTPRFPYNFWWKNRPAKQDAALPAPSTPINRLEGIAGFYDDQARARHDGGEAGAARDAAADEASANAGSADERPADGSWHVLEDWRPGLGKSSQSLFVPEHYEPKYAYPLLVWITEDGVACDLASVMLDVSTRNFFGLAFPVPRLDQNAEGAEPPAEARTALLDAVKEAVLTVRRQFHIHSERIYLAGFGAGAGWALQLILQKPDWFGGAAVLGGRVGSMKEALAQVSNLQGKRVLLGVGGREGGESFDELARTSQALHSAGVNVETQLFDSGRESTTRLLNQVNRWMIDGICAPA